MPGREKICQFKKKIKILAKNSTIILGDGKNFKKSSLKNRKFVDGGYTAANRGLDVAVVMPVWANEIEFL
jgi:hypothetical protein